MSMYLYQTTAEYSVLLIDLCYLSNPSPAGMLYSQGTSVAGPTNINMPLCVQCDLETRRHFFKAVGFKSMQEVEVVPG